MKKSLPVLAMLLVIVCAGEAQILPQMRNEDKIRIREAINISNRFGDAVWKGMDKVPFVVLLITDSVEFLVNHPYPSVDFKISEEDRILNTKIFYRERQFPKTFLATFPAVNGVNCIVAGTPENTGKNSTDWIITLLHEHFHQHQYTQKDYYSSVATLNLSGGDETGMWQLNYPFPYDSLPVSMQYTNYANALSKAVSAINGGDFKQIFNMFFDERKKLMHLLKPADYRYFSFQLWQEGIARYTEYKFLQLLDNYQPSPAISRLADFISFKKFKEEFLQSHLKSVTVLELDKEKRVCFYALGLAEGLLLDKLNQEWRLQYFDKKFFIENYAKEFDKGYK
jgi:hypothetical protein